MSKAFDDIMAGMQDAIAYLDGDKTRGRATVPELDVAKVRAKTGLSQDRFADAFGLSASTVRGLEQGRTKAEGATRVLLTLIDRDALWVLKTLRGAPQSAPRSRAAGKRHAAG